MTLQERIAALSPETLRGPSEALVREISEAIQAEAKTNPAGAYEALQVVVVWNWTYDRFPDMIPALEALGPYCLEKGLITADWV